MKAALFRVLIVIPKELEGQRLDQALAQLLPDAAKMPLSKAKIRKLIVAGAVYMNRGRVRIASKMVRTGTRLEVMIDPQKLLTESERGDGEKEREWKPSDVAIIHEDEWIVGLNKPAGLPTQPTLDEARANLYALLKKFFVERGDKDPYVGLHHRLDRDTSGVMLFTKKKEPNAEVGRIFQKHLAQKTYLAIVAVAERRESGSGRIGAKGSRLLPPSWTVENFLGREGGKAGKMRSVRSGGDRAVTEFRCLAQSGNYALVEAKPQTGRMHQIRVHLSEGGAPIVGDATYDGMRETKEGAIPRVMLHAVALTFPHPVTKLEISFTAPLPTDFEKCLLQLGLPLTPNVS
jgi:RluA family pseudouridine synthase